MSLPREVLPMATYLLTRRTILRHTLLSPDDAMTNMFVYLLAVIAPRFRLRVHAFCVLSTHIHLVVTDVDGKLSDFLSVFHRILSLCTRKLRKWHDVVWDKSQTSAVRLETPAAVVETIAYVLAKPVAAGLVGRAEEWTGAKVLVKDLGQAKLPAQRPAVYLDPKNPAWPPQATLPIALPPGIAPAEAASFRSQVVTEVDRLEAEAHATLQEKAPSSASPTSPAAPTTPTPEPTPRFAVGRAEESAWHRAVLAARAFQASYEVALKDWCDGARNAVFPVGTWLMRVLHHATVATAARGTAP